MQARFYAPQYGRFLSPDPARDQHFEETQSWNIYSYCQNNPVMKIDPTGMAPDPVPTDNPITEHAFRNEADKAASKAQKDAQTKKEDLGNNIKFEKTGIRNENKVKAAVKKAMNTKVVEKAHNRGQKAQNGRPLIVRATDKTGDRAAYWDPKDNSVNINPNGTFYLMTANGPAATPLDVVAAHEIGHEDGTRDVGGPNLMDNVNKTENPYRQVMGIKPRTSYKGGGFVSEASATVVVTAQ
ncbi:hypothetical protein GETHLI_33880 [Geothrix limicola]|uniref:RHS repeat-associated core domain-containing protein n=1 Tax=Geothrix limicola TaxID=2927978 RepID=A0ABQ5QKN4_9BACT|nr:RHS repeat-associated core domain-containing protein [Geothrix limicola]GLH74886.1 hypothetical protein GETHLI_33880 [Geothrix limicola]